MLTPAQKHFQKVMAERHGKTDEQTDTARTAHEQILHRLRMDQSALRKVQSDQAKAAMKRQLLPNYEGWVEGTLAGGSGRQDEVITTLMVWAVDAGDYSLAVRIGRYAVSHNLLMPDRFNRTPATVLVDEICDPILVQVKADDSTDITPYLAVLDDVEEITANSDMPDVVRAKLCKARAFALRSGSAEEQETALSLLRQALTLDAGAGVKKEIDRLARAVKKASSTADSADGATNDSGSTTGDAGISGAETASATAGSIAEQPATVAEKPAPRTRRNTSEKARTGAKSGGQARKRKAPTEKTK